MENTGYITITRQSGLAREMRVVANNIANLSTTGFKQEGVVFSEFIQSVPQGRSLSMGQGNVRETVFDQGALTQTGGQFDFAIQGDGFFQIETVEGPRLTRAGSFTPSAEGELVNYDGLRVLDIGGAPIFVPPDAQIAVAGDGTISADGQPVGQIGLVTPADDKDLLRQGGVLFEAVNGIEPAEDARIMQGFVENSNVNAVGQIARMIEVQRAYEMGQKFLEREDERVRTAMKALMT